MSRATKLSLAKDAGRTASDILPDVLTECKEQHQAFQAFIAPVWDETTQKTQLLKQIHKEISIQASKRNGERKAQLIEAAIRALEEQGVSEEDLKEYFREALIEEEASK